MRKNNHNNRRKTRTGSKGSALAEPPVCTAGQRETVREGLRILARVIAGAHRGGRHRRPRRNRGAAVG